MLYTTVREGLPEAIGRRDWLPFEPSEEDSRRRRAGTPMRIDILTIFPRMFRGPFDESIVKRAVDAGLVSIHLHDIRQWAKDRHKTVDDYPYGGGPGMGMKPDVVFAATEAVLELAPQRAPVVLLTPGGRPPTQ